MNRGTTWSFQNPTTGSLRRYPSTPQPAPNTFREHDQTRGTGGLAFALVVDEHRRREERYPGMSLDEQGLHELLEESEDLHADAMRVHAATMPDLADHASDTRHDDIDPNAASASTPAVVSSSASSASPTTVS